MIGLQDDSKGGFRPPGKGLATQEAVALLAAHGSNSIPEKPPVPVWRRFLAQFKSPLIYILLFALLVDISIWYFEGASGFPVEGFAIGVILLLNALLGVYQEGKSEAALSRLKAMAAPNTWVMRDGHLVKIPSAGIVPGDIVRIEGGDRIPADGVLHSAEGLLVDESILTGESVPVEKRSGGELFSGTLVQRGRVYFEVVRTGSASAMGRLAVMIGGIERGRTPLEQKLDVFARQVSKVISALALAIFVSGLLIEGVDRLGHVLLFAVALAVAAIPEGLPAVLTLTLALGVERMAKRKAVVRRLSAVEALGSVTVIATDKTGTLTENRMTVRSIDCIDEARLLKAIVLANDADHDTDAGDSLEQGLLEHARSRFIEPAAIRERHLRTSTLPFDSSYKFMRVTVEEDGRKVSYLKGAPEVLISKSTLGADEKKEWEGRVERRASEGYRVLGVGYADGEADHGITFLGIVMMWDPPREEVPGAIRTAMAAGIKVVMVTGDHPATALAVARAIGIPAKRVHTGEEMRGMTDDVVFEAAEDSAVFARVSPEDKLRLVEALQRKGAVVAMTGDGVNDAPALKRSDVGIAMGKRGSDVSREVADIVLVDDNFVNIVAAIEEGRSIYENIQKFIRFLFSTNLSFVLLVLFGSFGSFALGLVDESGALLLPLTAVQMLWINVITDGLPALALGFDRNPHVMDSAPRPPKQPLLDRVAVRFIVSTAVLKTSFSGAILILAPLAGYTLIAARTVVFMFEGVAELLMSYPSRRVSVVPSTNMVLHASVFGGITVQVAALGFEPLRVLLGLEVLDAGAVAAVAVCGLSVWVLAEVVTKLMFRRSEPHVG